MTGFASAGEKQRLLVGINHRQNGIARHADEGTQRQRNDDEYPFSPLERIVVFFIAALLLILPLKTLMRIQENLPPHSALRNSSSQLPEEVTLQQVANTSLEILNANLPMAPIHGTNIHHPYCETTVLLIRHCDDHGIYARDDEESGDKHCSHIGYERTQYLSTLFGGNGTRRWPHPSHLFALLPELPYGTNYRQIETLLPLAQQEDIPIHVVNQPQQVSSAIFELLRSSATTPEEEICDTVTVVAWKHAFIPALAAYLGCGPDQGCRETYPDDDFDQVWELKFVFRPTAPMDEVLGLVRAKSPMIADDYNLLSSLVDDDKEIVSTATAAEDNNMDVSSSQLGWTVYGSMTSQRFDPLAMDYRMRASNKDRPKEGREGSIYQIR